MNMARKHGFREKLHKHRWLMWTAIGGGVLALLWFMGGK
jgi:hypothetical protein